MRTAKRTDSYTALAATQNSAAFGLEHMEGYSLTIKATETVASLVGTLKLQACNNAFLDNVNLAEDPAAVWVDISGSSTNVSGSGNFLWNTGDYARYAAVRWVWTRTSGTGDFTAYWHAAGVQS